MDSFEMSTYRLSSDCSSSELHGKKFVAGAIGFEPMHVGIKIRCLNQLGEAPTKNLASRQGLEPRTAGFGDQNSAN